MMMRRGLSTARNADFACWNQVEGTAIREHSVRLGVPGGTWPVNVLTTRREGRCPPVPLFQVDRDGSRGSSDPRRVERNRSGSAQLLLVDPVAAKKLLVARGPRRAFA